MESHEKGYVNWRGQVNLGWLDRPKRGAWPEQGIYRMHCLYCGETYGTMTSVGVRRCTTPDCLSQRDVKWGDDGPALTAEERPETEQERRAQAIEVLRAAQAQ